MIEARKGYKHDPIFVRGLKVTRLNKSEIK